MAKPFNLGNYDFDAVSGKWYIRSSGEFVRNKNTLNRIYQSTGTTPPVKRSVTKAPKIMTERARIGAKATKQFQSLFGAKVVQSSGHLQKWVSPLMIKGGAQPYNNWHTPKYVSFFDQKKGSYGEYNFKGQGKILRVKGGEKWGSRLSNGKGTAPYVLVGTREWVKQLGMAMHALTTGTENFRVAVGYRAVKIFQKSIEQERFYSKQSKTWAALESSTLKKRERRRTGRHKLKEYSDLYNSIKVENNDGSLKTTVYTDVVRANSKHHKRHNICYAGYHNEGSGTYGRSKNGKMAPAYKKRQFMGHSSRLDPMQDRLIRLLMDRHLFESVFMTKKG